MAINLRSRPEFLRRLSLFVAIAIGVLAVCLGGGVIGYHVFVGLGWIDSLLNASIILTGMGPVDTMPDDAAKVFASLYALVSGAVYPTLGALILYPIVHRMMAVLHLQSLSPPDPTDVDDSP